MQRLRNEWSNGVFRQSSDEKIGLSRQTYDGGGGGRNQQLSSDSDDSRGRLARASCAIRSDSNSDSDHKKWTKNPLVVRRVKRSDKLKQAEKRLSGTDNVFSTKNRESLISQNNEESRNRSANLGVRNASPKDEGSGSKASTKYQRLEQMRKMRLNLSVTSDEENVPQRPQPHRWSGPNIRNFTVPNKDTEPVSHQGMVRSQFSQEFYKAVNSPPALAPQSYLPPSHNAQPAADSPLYHLKQHVQPGTANTSSPWSNVSTGLGLQPAASGLGQTTSRFGHTQTQGAGHFPDSSVTSSRQVFHPLSRQAGSENSSYKLTEISSSRSYPTDFSNSSNFTTHRFTSEVSVPSTGSPRESKTNASINHPIMASHNLAYFNARQIPPQERLQPAAALRPSSYSTSGLEKRQTATNKNESKPPQKIPRKMLPRSGVLEGNDSLDELVESNIQYLSSDVDKARPKKSSTTNVIKFSSLPDHGKTTSRGLSNTPPRNQASIQVQASASIQLHVTLPAETPHMGTSLIQIAPSVDSDYHPSFGFRNQLTSQPDLIPRNCSQNVHAPLSQTRNDYNKGIVTTALGQTDARVALPSHVPLGTVHTRMGFGDKKPRSDTEISRHPPTLDKGMFSDVEYDIEVSQRVKKWETLMKARDLVPTSDKKDLIPINENVDSDPVVDAARSIHKTLLPSKQSTYSSSYTGESNQATVPRVLSIETNARRFFQVIPDPRLNINSQDVSNRMFQTPLSLRPEKTFTSASDLRQQVLANRLHHLPVTSSPVQVTYKPPVAADNGHQASSQREIPYSGQQTSTQRDTPLVKRTSNVNDVRNSEKRGSKFREEIDEISYMKSDSVGNLRRRFDTDSTNATSEDDKKSVSTASAKLSLPSKEYSSQKESTDWSQVLPSYHTKMTDSEVWSPNLESTQGVPVSIERVTARTLQTIPFSDDPFWKEIEQMTTFDPTSKEGMQTIEPIRSHHQVQLISPQSFTLPIQPHRNVSSVVDKMQKSKSLYTPNITPLPVDVSGKSVSNAANALDGVLNEINRSPLGGKQLSPKKRSLEVDSLPTNVTASGVSHFLRARPKSGQFGKYENGQLVFVNPGSGGNMGSTRTLDSGIPGPDRLDMLTTQQQPLQFSQQQQSLHFSQKQQPLQLSQQQQPLQFSQQQPLQFSQQQPLQFSQQQQQQPLPFSQQQKQLLPFSQQQQQPLQFSQHQQPLPFSQQQQQPLPFSQQKQLLQFFQQPRQHPQPNATNRYAQASQGFTNNYQLDPNLLKQKLLKTGLVVEADMEETGDRGQYQSSSLDRPAHDIIQSGNIMGQPFSRVASKKHSDTRVEEPIATTSSPHFRNSDISAVNKNIFQQVPGKQPGSKTLDEIQKALAPFSSTTYQPDPETLYGASTLQAFKDHTCDTSKGLHTSATGWSYHTELNKDVEGSNTVDSSLSGGSSRLQEVNESMDDLTNLARDVELRINEIKNKLQTADETSLDNILLSLRKLTPEVRSQETDTTPCENYYEKKKSKLSDALSELDRIYTSLELNADDTNTLHTTEKPRSESSSYVRGPQPRSVHLRPMQTRISSVFIRDIDANQMPESQERESEFDVISKSFQAIVDEVNQTTDLLSRAVERSKQGSVAPETHKLVSKSTVKPGNAGKEIITTAHSSAQSDTVPTSQNSVSHMLNSVKETVGEATSTTSLSFSSGQHQTRFRPVKDNRIIQDDRATRKDSEERVLKVISSPKPSPILIRKLFTGDQVSQTKQNLPPHDASVKQSAEITTVPLQSNVKEQTNLVENKDIRKSDLSVQPSPSSKNKAIPSVENNQTETLVQDSNDGINSSTSPYLASKYEADKLAATLQTTVVSKTTDSNNTSAGLRLSSASASTASSIFVPAVGSSKQARLVQAGAKCEELESISKDGNKAKRQLGSGVAMMLGRFSSSQESIDGSKKSTTTRSGDKDGSGEENTENEVVLAATQPAEIVGGRVTSESKMKSPIRSSTKVKPIRSYDVKPAALSSIERKVLDREATLLNSGASSPQPCSPVNKPPQSPWTRHTSDPEKQSVADAIKAYSPKFVSKIPRPASSNGSTASDGYFTPKELDSPRQAVGSPAIATSKERPPIWKSPNSSPRGRGRPHSFHELISVFEKDSPNKLQTFDKFRKCASADEVSSNNALAGRGFRCKKTVPEEATPEKWTPT